MAKAPKKPAAPAAGKTSGGRKPQGRRPPPASRVAEKYAHDERRLSIAELHKTIRWIGVSFAVVALGGFCYLAVDSTAGKDTNYNLNALLGAAVDAKASRYVYLTVLALVGGTAYYNYKGRKKAERAASRAADLERLIDPNRTGTGLLEDGTNPEGDPE